MDGDRAPVMADVARIAGVSHQTVSRVLHDHPNVRPRTRERVLAAVRELGYRPNAAARTLASRRTRTLGVISFNTTLYGPACMLYGIEQAAREHEYSVTVAAVGTLDRYSVLDAVDRLRDQNVAGIVVIAPQTAAVGALANVPADVPLVAVGCGTHTALVSVAVDNEAGAELATSYLLDLGHRTVHHLVGPRSWLDAQEREAGWRAALEKRGLPCPNRRPAPTGRLVPDTSTAVGSPPTPRSPRCSAPTTTWPSACCGPCSRQGAGCRRTSASWVSTTCRRPSTSARR